MTPGIPVTRWRPTASLARGLVVGVCCALLAVSLGRPDLWVLGAPLLVAGLFALSGRPPRNQAPLPPVADLAHRSLPEGQATVLRTRMTGLAGAEQVTRTVDPVRFLDPATGPGGVCVRREPSLVGHQVDIEVSARRWGVREYGDGQVAATSPWSGWRWGPHHTVGGALTVLPSPVGFASRAQAPHPLGLVGVNESRRAGDGSEFAGIRPFTVGDRLRRINWRVSLATGDLHVVETRAEQDTAVLLLVDAIAEVGTSTGFGGRASSLDLTVRAAAALTEHHTRVGDRVGLTLVGPGSAPVGFGAGSAHRMRILHALARVRPGRGEDDEPGRFRLRAPEGTVVLMLTPMLDPLSATLAGTVARGGLPLVVVDTLPADVQHRGATVQDRAITAAAWRIRMMERDLVLREVARAGCPVVPWRGPGTLDEVMERLVRQARLPRVVNRG